MENLLYQLKGDIQFMLKLEHEISDLNARLLYVGDLNDKRNYNEKLSTAMFDKSKDLSRKLSSMKNKWGV